MTQESKFINVCIAFNPCHVNHTALFAGGLTAAGQNGTDMKIGSFQRQYKTVGARDKWTGSREHQEVLSRAVNAMNLKVVFTSPFCAVVYQKIKRDDTVRHNKLVAQLTTFLKQYRRFNTKAPSSSATVFTNNVFIVPGPVFRPKQMDVINKLAF